MKYNGKKHMKVHTLKHGLVSIVDNMKETMKNFIVETMKETIKFNGKKHMLVNTYQLMKVNMTPNIKELMLDNM